MLYYAKYYRKLYIFLNDDNNITVNIFTHTPLGYKRLHSFFPLKPSDFVPVAYRGSSLERGRRELKPNIYVFIYYRLNTGGSWRDYCGSR